MVEEQGKEQNEESSLAEEFEPSSFMEGNSMGEGTSEQPSERMEGDEDNESESTKEEEEEEIEDEGSDWESNTEDETEESDEEEESEELDESEDEDEESDYEEVSSESDGWEAVAEAVGIDADDYESFIDKLKNQQLLASEGATNQKINGLNQLVSLDDETLMRRELEARGFNTEEIEDELDIMIENNTIRSKARGVRKDLEGVIVREKDALANQDSEIDATQQEEIEAAADEVREHMSKTKEMFGGRINSNQQDAHTEYLTSGTFFDEITADPQSMAEAAWLWKYREQILGSQKSAGREQGKASVLDKMINPEPTRRTNIPDPETGDFNPSRFTESEQM